MISPLAAVLVLAAGLIYHADALPIGASTNPINASNRALVQALVTFIVTPIMLKLYHKAGLLIYILAFITAFANKYPTQLSVLMFTLKLALALTVIEVFFADDLSDWQWKLLENCWKVLQMWMVIFIGYLKLTLASSSKTESSDESDQTNTTDDANNTNNNIENNNGSNDNSSGSSGTNEQSPLLPSVKSSEPKPSAEDSV